MIDREKLDALVDEGWLRSCRHPEADLWIYNYTERTQYDRHWTEETLMCRGLILDADGNVVARPFPKFFNLGDPMAPELPSEPYTVTEKIDGSLGILYYLDGERFIASRGSFTSEQAREGSRMIRDVQLEHWADSTPLFEIVYPGNRIVVDYGQRRELILLTAVDHATGRDVEVVGYSGPKVAHHGMVDVGVLAERSEPNSEGFVVSFESGVRVKVKFAEYVRLHKIVTGVNARRVWESLSAGDDLAAMLDGIPDEVYGWIEGMRSELEAAYRDEEASAKRVFDDRPPTDDRKTLALHFLAGDANSAVLFRMLDGKPYDDLIWKSIKPEATAPIFGVTEDVA